MECDSQGTKIVKWDRKILTLAFSEMCDRFVFYGTLTMLILYLTSVYHFSDQKAYDLWGAYIAFGFGLPVVGGYCADRFLGLSQAIKLGAYSIIIGCLFLLFNQIVLFYIGLSILLIGIGFFKGNISAYLGTFYQEDSNQKDQAYTLFFMGMTSGALLGPVVFGLLIKYVGWHAGFCLAAIGMIITLFLFSKIESKSSSDVFIINKLAYPKYIFFYICFISFIAILFNFAFIANIFTALLAFSAIFIISIYVIQKDKQSITNVIGIILLGLITIGFYASSFQVDGSLLLYVKRFTEHRIINWIIPPGTFSSLSSFAALISAPFLARFWGVLSEKGILLKPTHKILFGYVATIISFLIMNLSTHFDGQNYLNLLFIFVGNIFLGIGSSCIIPITLSAVSHYAPKKLVGTLMGIMFLVAAVSGFFASVLGKLTKSSNSLYLIGGIQRLFFDTALLLIIFFLILLILTPIIHKLLSEN